MRWCVENDRGVPDVFLAEVEAAIERLSELPYSGHLYEKSPIDAVRRVLLRRSGYHLYYTTDADVSDVVVRAVWYAGRGAGPVLG